MSKPEFEAIASELFSDIDELIELTEQGKRSFKLDIRRLADQYAKQAVREGRINEVARLSKEFTAERIKPFVTEYQERRFKELTKPEQGKRE